MNPQALLELAVNFMSTVDEYKQAIAITQSEIDQHKLEIVTTRREIDQNKKRACLSLSEDRSTDT
jgi:hypothetical protein